MSKTLKWKGEVTFEGTVEQFQSFKETMEKQPNVSIFVSELMRFKGPYAGYAGILVDYIPAGKLTEGVPSMPFTGIKGIAGGIRTPHLHLGDEVFLFDKERFKAIIGEVARNIFENRVETGEDFYKIIEPLTGG